MQLEIATITNIFVLSSTYIMVALGFSLLFNVLGIINFTHGALYMVGGYICYALATIVGINPWIALVLTTIILALFGMFLEKFCFRPFLGNFNRTVMVCVFITVILQTVVNIIIGTKVLALPPLIQGKLVIGQFTVSYVRLTTFVIGASLLAAMVWLTNRTKFGHQMQAISQNLEGAKLQGINIKRICSLSTALGCGLAGIAGCLVGGYLGLNPFMGDTMLVKVLILVILAGLGNTSGIFISGFILGSLDSVLPILTGGAISSAISISIVVVVILFRPRGFFGHEA